MTLRSGVLKMFGNNQGTDIPTSPTTSPNNAPIITSDFSRVRAFFDIPKPLEDLEKHVHTKFLESYME